MITRQRVLEMINPEAWAKEQLYAEDYEHTAMDRLMSPVSENTLLRLAFHDCLRYKDGTGGCDGCISWSGMGERYLNFHMIGSLQQFATPQFHYPPKEYTDNNGMDRQVKYLEKIYTTVDWPETYTGPRLATSLQESGKSRADLWAFAGWVALERTIERANYACDHDIHGRQQVPLLEGREKCDIKLTKPIKFSYGRVDCIPEDPEMPYKASKEEAHPKLFGSGHETVDFILENFNLTSADFIALSAIHSQSGKFDKRILGTKYTWFGNSYLSNMYHKMLANRPTYQFDLGGDTTFGITNPQQHRAGSRFNTTSLKFHSVGGVDGEPVAYRGWRVVCQTLWNTTEGGPCFMRPTQTGSFDTPNKGQLVVDCFDGLDEDGKPTVWNNTKNCEGAFFDENGVQHGGRLLVPGGHHSNDSFYGFSNNQFALPYEVGKTCQSIPWVSIFVHSRSSQAI